MKKKHKTTSSAEFWVLDTGIQGMSSGTIQARGPFSSQHAAEQWIADSSAEDWIESCGCLRTGEPENWGDVHTIVQVVRKVRPVPPSHVQMTLVDAETV